jgi:hypothetical protein
LINKNSITDFCASIANFERVFTFIPSITGVEHAGSGLGAFSTSTKHILQLAATVNFL